MKFKNRFTNNKLLIRMIISYLLTSILLTGILLFAVSNFISSKTKVNTTEAQKDLMRQSYNTAYYALTDIYGDFYQLWSKDQNILNGINNADISPEDIKAISQSIENAVFRDVLVDSVYLINKKADLVISNVESPTNISIFHDQSGIGLFNDFEDNYDLYKNEVFFPRKTSYKLDGIDYNKNYISVVYAVRDKDKNLNSGIVVNIDQNRLSSLLNSEDGLGSMIIANSSGEIISDSEGMSFGTKLQKHDIYNKISNNPNDEDSFTGNYLGEKAFITYKKANNIGFVFISITPYSFLTDQVFEINKVIGILFIIAMLISLIVSVISIKQIYQPLNRLIKDMKENPAIDNSHGMDEYAFLEDSYNNLINKNRRAHVARIFNGNHIDSTANILDISKEKFLALAIIPDDDSCRYPDLLERVIHIMEAYPHWIGTITSKDCISFIINEDDFDDNRMDVIMEELVNFQTLISDEMDITISIGVGNVVNSLESIKFSHRYAMLAINYALSIGENQVVLYNEIEDTKLAASVNKDSIADKIEIYVNNNFTRQDFSANEIAEEIELSLGYIRQIFKSEKNITLNEYIISCRIEKAKELLLDTDHTAKDISESVGYYDNRYFYTIFKKRVGMTTDEYRQSQGEVSK